MWRLSSIFRNGIRWDMLTTSQRELCTRLDQIRTSIDAPEVKKGWLDRIIGAKAPPTQKGMYIYGGVGQGKTVLMDQFYKQVEAQKMRVHFHEFMIKVQKELHLQKSETDVDIMDRVARKAVGDARLLCLDEFFVNHISDAMVLKPLFERIFSMGVVVICTSNRPPEDLYKNGLNRDRFLPFIPLLKSNCEVFHLKAHDFRQEHNFADSLAAAEKVYFYDPKDDESTLLKEFRSRCGDHMVTDKEVKISSYRHVTVPLSGNGQAYFQFSQLCGSQIGRNGDSRQQFSLGTEAFLVLADNFHTIWISNVPQFDASNETDGSLRSFILLIDVLYERNVKIFIASKIPMLRLFGVVGIVRIADNFQKKLFATYSSFEQFQKTVAPLITQEEFQKLVKGLELPEPESWLLFEAMLPPDENELLPQRIWDICKNHRDMLQGLPPSSNCLYRFDVRGECVLENEFVCSRALSRLFHMSSGNYHEIHRQRYLANECPVGPGP